MGVPTIRNTFISPRLISKFHAIQIRNHNGFFFCSFFSSPCPYV